MKFYLDKLRFDICTVQCQWVYFFTEHSVKFKTHTAICFLHNYIIMSPIFMKFFRIPFVLYLHSYGIFRYIKIFYATGLYCYYCITKITRIKGENDKLTEAN